MLVEVDTKRRSLSLDIPAQMPCHLPLRLCSQNPDVRFPGFHTGGLFNFIFTKFQLDKAVWPIGGGFLQ